EDRESHLGGYFWKRFGEEVCRSHAALHRAERMLDRLATQAHGLWVCIKALLHSFEQMLMLPSRNPPLWPCRALRFERTILTSCGPVRWASISNEFQWHRYSSRQFSLN